MYQNKGFSFDFVGTRHLGFKDNFESFLILIHFRTSYFCALWLHETFEHFRAYTFSKPSKPLAKNFL